MFAQLNNKMFKLKFSMLMIYMIITFISVWGLASYPGLFLIVASILESFTYVPLIFFIVIYAIEKKKPVEITKSQLIFDMVLILVSSISFVFVGIASACTGIIISPPFLFITILIPLNLTVFIMSVITYVKRAKLNKKHNYVVITKKEKYQVADMFVSTSFAPLGLFSFMCFLFSFGSFDKPELLLQLFVTLSGLVAYACYFGARIIQKMKNNEYLSDKKDMYCSFIQLGGTTVSLVTGIGLVFGNFSKISLGGGLPVFVFVMIVYFIVFVSLILIVTYIAKYFNKNKYVEVIDN